MRMLCGTCWWEWKKEEKDNFELDPIEFNKLINLRAGAKVREFIRTFIYPSTTS